MIEQIYSAVRWRESIVCMSKQGVENFVEIGPGKTLSGMVKRTIKDKKVNCFSINSIADIKKLNDEFKDKVLITGSTGGIGYSIVNISSLGAKVAQVEQMKKN